MASTKKYIYTIDDGCFHAAHLLLLVVSCSSTLGAIGWGLQGATSGMEDAKDQIVQESKNSTLPSQDEKNPFVPGREIPPDAQDQIQRFYHRMLCLLGIKIWFRLIRKMKNFRTVGFVLRDMKEPLMKLLFWRLAIWVYGIFFLLRMFAHLCDLYFRMILFYGGIFS
ncbi:uncharacterized protein [Gossypium hirsutum]|uniref:Uncharacterized protein isoform X2 n=1 Tax=Gossypium hirsutum TaxID=3635 RepID=A0ABM2ZTQ8_GOSHI|nr:uncharacterized protein LOC107891407 isoform X2 [Gossypium hirsutum]